MTPQPDTRTFQDFSAQQEAVTVRAHVDKGQDDFFRGNEVVLILIEIAIQAEHHTIQRQTHVPADPGTVNCQAWN
ncbi:hypothetical protein [Paraburkholderia sp. GAS348]|jgi:hypothetical protein|uniref:hypothetical protein n=1 Tax=Paraburkholderia sp. GAS348 TaxID=3035132 RepID=UPI003D22997C